MEIEGSANSKKTTDSDYMMEEKCSFFYVKKRKNPYPDNDKIKYRPCVVNNTLKNMIKAKHNKQDNMKM